MSSLPDEIPPQAPPEAQPYGEVFDRGYRHYDGQREGRPHAIRALVGYSIGRGLGLKKRWTAKIIPFSLYAIAFAPVIVVIGIRAFLGSLADRFGFGYPMLYDVLGFIILIFAAATAPQMLCDDRRQHVLHLYFSRALSRSDYLLAKIGSLGILIGSIAFLPAFLLFLGNTFLAASPVQYFVDHIGDLGRIVAAGGLIALFYASITLVVAAYVDRTGIASAISVGGILIVSAIGGALFETIGSEWRSYVALTNLLLIPQGLTQWVFGTTLPSSSPVAQAGLAGEWYLAAVVLLAVVCGVVMHRRYLMED